MTTEVCPQAAHLQSFNFIILMLNEVLTGVIHLHFIKYLSDMSQKTSASFGSISKTFTAEIYCEKMWKKKGEEI